MPQLPLLLLPLLSPRAPAAAAPAAPFCSCPCCPLPLLLNRCNASSSAAAVDTQPNISVRRLRLKAAQNSRKAPYAIKWWGWNAGCCCCISVSAGALEFISSADPDLARGRRCRTKPHKLVTTMSNTRGLIYIVDKQRPNLTKQKATLKLFSKCPFLEN